MNIRENYMINKYLSQEESKDEKLLQQILAASAKDFLLGSVKRLSGGSKSYAFAVNNYVVRFPKAEIIWQTMQREQIILDQIYPLLNAKYKQKIHKITLVEHEYPFSFTQLFNGKICDNREDANSAINVRQLNSEQFDILAKSIAEFFILIHSLDYKKIFVPPVNEAIDNWDVTAKHGFDEDRASVALQKYANKDLSLGIYKPQNKNQTLALCHNDLSGSNLLLNPQNKDILEGIIDFANMTVMPKYLDFIPLYKISRKLVIRVLEKYNSLSADKIEQKQLDYAILAYIGFELSKGPNPYFLKLLNWFLEE